MMRLLTRNRKVRNQANWNFSGYLVFLSWFSPCQFIKCLLKRGQEREVQHAQQCTAGRPELFGCQIPWDTKHLIVSFQYEIEKNSRKNYNSGAKGLKIGRLPPKSGALAGLSVGRHQLCPTGLSFRDNSLLALDTECDVEWCCCFFAVHAVMHW